MTGAFVIVDGSLNFIEAPADMPAPTLEWLQAQVGGYIEALPALEGRLDVDTTMGVYINEDGRAACQPNCRVPIYGQIYGNIVIIGYRKGESVWLDQEDCYSDVAWKFGWDDRDLEEFDND